MSAEYVAFPVDPGVAITAANQEDDGAEDFLTSIMAVTTPANEGTIPSSSSSSYSMAENKDTEKDNSANNNDTSYKSRKPLWWTKLGRVRPTKGQKKAIRAMEATHQLPRLPYGRLYEWQTVFRGNESSELRMPWLEIGSGTGENVLATAERNPLQPLIGAEMHASGIGKCYQRIYQATRRQRYWQGYIPYSQELEHHYQTIGSHELIDKEESNENYTDESIYSSSELPASLHGPYTNVRVFAGNGVKVLQVSPDESLDAVLITFPDPFPHQPSYRLLQMDVLDEIWRTLRRAGRLVVATDHNGHATWAQSQIQQQQQHSKWKRIEATPSVRQLYLPVISKYEAKGWREGRSTKVLIFEKTIMESKE